MDDLVHLLSILLDNSGLDADGPLSVADAPGKGLKDLRIGALDLKKMDECRAGL